MKKLIIIMLAALTLEGCGDKEKEKEKKVYTVTFDADGGAPVPPKQTVEADEVATAPQTNPAKQGFVFMFWSLNGANAAYNFQTPVTGNITLVAKWEEEAKVEYWQVTWNLNDGAWATGYTPPAQVVKGGTLAEPTEPVKAGSTFEGWYKEEALTNKVAFPYNVSGVTANITLYAKWNEESVVEYWQVTWELNDGAWAEGYAPTTKVEKDGTLAEPDEPVKANNTLEGWYKEATLTNKVTFPYDVSGVTGDFTLYAKWEAVTSGDCAPAGYQMFTSISALKTWLSSQPANTAETPYKVGLKGVNLDTGNNWNDLGLAVKGSNYVELNLQCCSGTTIPDGKSVANTSVITYYGTFIGVNNLVAIHFPDNLNTIGDYAFRSCSNLGAVTLPQGLININKHAFEGCEKLTSLELPKGLKKIRYNAFAQNGFTSVIIPGSVDEWEDYAFYKCSSLQSVVVEEDIEVIGKYAFAGCGQLSSVVLPASLKTIGENAFATCGFEVITLPQGLVSIRGRAFTSNAKLSSINLPTSLKNIGDEAFSHCALVSVSIPEGLEYLGSGLFRGCTALVNVSLPNDMILLLEGFFSGCTALETITVPASVSHVQRYAFGSCAALTEVIMLPTSPPSMTNEWFTVFTDTHASLKIKVPAASLSAYKTAYGWSSYASRIESNN